MNSPNAVHHFVKSFPGLRSLTLCNGNLDCTAAVALLQGLPLLESLNLASNILNNGNPEALIGEFPKLRHLDLSCSALTTQELKRLTEHASFPNLEALFLQCNCAWKPPPGGGALIGVATLHAEPIVALIQKSPKLRVLNVSTNYFTQGEFHALVQGVIHHGPRLEEVDASFNLLSHECLPDMLLLLNKCKRVMLRQKFY